MTENYGLAEINTLEDAKDAWESFGGRFFSPEIPPGVDVAFKSDLRQFTPRKNKDAKYNPPEFEDKERTLHSDDFDDFLNGNTVNIPQNIILDEQTLEEVRQAIEAGDYKNEALNKDTHTFYALWLFKQNKITRQQMTTLLVRAQIPKEYPLLETFYIFDEKGEFTTEALELWLPALRKSWLGKGYDRQTLRRLLLLIEAAPKSEQIFFISKRNPNIISMERNTLGNALKTNRTWHTTTYQGKTHDLHFSFGVIEAIQIAQHGINGAAASRAKLGKIGINAVKEGVEFYYRPTAISMPDSGIEATTKNIHAFAESPMPAVTAHDVYHARLHNTIPPEFHMMLNHMHQIISKHTKQSWSSTMWQLVDREFLAFANSKAPEFPKNSTQFFLKMLHYPDNAFLFKEPGLLELSTDGFALFWNMVNQSEIWKKLYKVDINRLGYPYSQIIHKMKIFKNEVGENHKHTEILTLKYHFFKTTSSTEFRHICKLIDNHSDELITDKVEKDVAETEQKLVFGKYAERRGKNFTALKFKNLGKVIKIEDRTVKQIFPILFNREFGSIFGENNKKVVDDAVNEINSEFRSIHQGSKFSTVMLKKSMDALPSITAKLDFLETCYENIIHSECYTRQHAIADKLFSFFKNPLTTSQREHILLLKKARDTLIREYKQMIPNQEEADYGEWLLKIRKSDVSLCNTERFYLPWNSSVTSINLK